MEIHVPRLPPMEEPIWERYVRQHIEAFGREHPGAVYVGVEGVRREPEGVVISFRWKVPQ